MKKGIVDIEDTEIEDMDKLHPVTYSWKDDKDDNKHYGFIAQDVQKIYPNTGQIAAGFPGYNVLATSSQLPTVNNQYYVIYFCCGYGGQASPSNKADINIYAGVRVVCSF